MGLIIRILLMAGAALAGLVVVRDGPSFLVVQGMASIVVLALIVGVLAFLFERR